MKQCAFLALLFRPTGSTAGCLADFRFDFAMHNLSAILLGYSKRELCEFYSRTFVLNEELFRQGSPTHTELWNTFGVASSGQDSAARPNSERNILGGW